MSDATLIHPETELLPAKLVSDGVFTALPDGEEDGFVTSHALQTIRASADDLYRLWHDVTLFPRWQEHVVSVTPVSGNRSHWVVGNPEDEKAKRIEFDSEITEDIPGRRIAWRSISDNVTQTGAVTFAAAPSGRGTLVTLIQRVKVPGGAVTNAGVGAAKRSPAQTIKENLRHFKELVETGEVPSVKGQPHGPRGVIGGIKEWMYGETNPTPPGTSDLA